MAQDHLQPWGAFSGLPIQASFDADGRTMHLLAGLEYSAPDGRKWLAPKGWKVDGASIPRAFWTIIGGPFEGKYREASVFHDVACDQRTRPWRDVAQMFYTAMRCNGVNEVQAKTMYYAVYNFGPHWPAPHPGQPFGLAKPRANVVEIMPAQPTEADAKRVHQWIAQHNPPLGELEAVAK